MSRGLCRGELVRIHRCPQATFRSSRQKRMILESRFHHALWRRPARVAEYSEQHEECRGTPSNAIAHCNQTEFVEPEVKTSCLSVFERVLWILGFALSRVTPGSENHFEQLTKLRSALPVISFQHTQ